MDDKDKDPKIERWRIIVAVISGIVIIALWIKKLFF